MLAIADAALGGAGFTHRTVCALDQADGRRLGEELEADPARRPGWEVERTRYVGALAQANVGLEAALSRAREVFAMVDSILDLQPERAAVADDLATWVEAQLVARTEARARRDFGTADQIRKALDESEGPKAATA